MKLFEAQVDATNDSEENSEKIDQLIYSLVDFISQLEDEGRVFKIIIEDMDDEVTSSPNKWLH